MYLVAVGDAAQARAFAIAEQVHDVLPDVKVEVNLGGGSFKAQLKRADKSGAEMALVLGDEEVADGMVGIKPLRRDTAQRRVAHDALLATLQDELRASAQGAD